MGSPNNYQVGGTHYKTAHEHWDWVEDNGIGYLEGCASKYLMRWRNKNGLEDLKKARHYTMKVIERLNDPVNPRQNRCDGARSSQFGDFAITNNLGALEGTACFILAYWTTEKQLHQAVDCINQIIRGNFPQELP